MEIMPSSPPLKILTMPLSAVNQYFRNEGRKFCSKFVVKDSQDCDAKLWLNHSLTLLFAFCNYYF